MNTRLTIAVQCHNFQRRLCWMLSSLIQQSIPMELVIDIAHMPFNGKPTTESLREYFGDKVNIRSTVFENREQFELRGLVRNRQMQECATEWMMFGDCDMVYHPDYFRRLLCELDSHHRFATYMISSGRMSVPKDECNTMIRSRVQDEAVEVVPSFWQAAAMPNREMRNCGAGFCQIVNMKHAPHGGYYVTAGENRDWSWSKGSNPRSDVQFRKRLSKAGGDRRSLPQWFTDNAIHLNHDRDPEAGKHIEDQR